MTPLEPRQFADTGRLYSVVISIKVKADSAEEAVRYLGNSVGTGLDQWSWKVECATELIDGSIASEEAS